MRDLLHGCLVGRRLHDAHATTGLRTRVELTGRAGRLGRIPVVDVQPDLAWLAPQPHRQRRSTVSPRVRQELAPGQHDRVDKWWCSQGRRCR